MSYKLNNINKILKLNLSFSSTETTLLNSLKFSFFRLIYLLIPKITINVILQVINITIQFFQMYFFNLGGTVKYLINLFINFK